MYQVYWDVPDYVLYLKLVGKVTSQELIEIDRIILDHLRQRTMGVALVIDLTSVETSFSNTQFKGSQTYARHPILKWILVIGNNKLMRLLLLLTFHLTRASVRFFDSIEETENYLQVMHLKQS